MKDMKQLERNLKILKTVEDIAKHELSEVQLKLKDTQSQIRDLENKLKILKAENEHSQVVRDFINKHPNGNYFYVGKADGINVFAITISCNTCNLDLELFSAHTGIGSVIIGVCPTCKCEVDLTNYKSW
jgi:hypothetical protein